MKKSILNALALGALLTAASSHASLLVNGGFENGLNGWSCTTPSGGCGTSNWHGPQEGAAHFWGYDNGPGGINSQSFATQIGGTYNISFFYGSSAPEPQNHLRLSVGNLNQTLSLTAGGWSSFSGTFTAVSSSTSLQYFFDTNPGTGTLVLDDIQVAAVASVSESGSLALFALGLTGLGFARRKKTV